MNIEEIKLVVRLTIEELTQRKLLQIDNYRNILNAVDKWLYDYFNNKNSSKSLTRVLHSLSDDPYIDIIYLQYRDYKTMEWIAEYFDKDVSTIKRNKKRLIMAIYEALEV